MDVVAAIVPIRAGNLAMYYPEANAIVPRRLDLASKAPAFKFVRARLTPFGNAPLPGDGAAILRVSGPE